MGFSRHRGERWFLESVLANLGAGVTVADENGEFLLVNPRAEQIIGIGAVDVPMSEWSERLGLYLPDQVTPYPAHELPLARAVRGESVGPTEVFVRQSARPAGLWVRVWAQPIRDPTGLLRGGVAVFSDITAQKKAEQELRRSEEKYRSMYDSTPAMLHSIDQHGRLMSVSDFWLVTLGYERSEVIGRPSVDFLTPKSRKFAKESVLPEFFRTGVCRDVPYELEKKNGDCIDVLLSAIAERDDQGKIVRSLAVLVDVTERNRLELGQRLLAEASRELVTSLDAEATIQRVAELTVPAFADLCIVLAADEDRALRPLALADTSPTRGRCLRELLPLEPPAPDEPRGPSRVMITQRSEVLHDSGAVPCLADFQRKPSLHVPLLAGRRCLGVLSWYFEQPHRSFSSTTQSLAEDLGRRIALALENAQLYREAQKSIRVRDEFLSIASHELKTPLTPMKLRVQQMRSVLEKPGPLPQLVEKLSGLVKVFDDQLLRMTSLVNHLLNVSLIHQGRLSLQLEEVDLGAIARVVAHQLEASLDKAGCALEVVAPVAVNGRWDRLRLEQVMINLLTNSMKYGAGQPIRMNVELHGAKARLSVEDHGMGIPFEAQKRIFEPYERAASHSYGGLGLGLFITRHIVEAHGGTIRVQSTPGKGATFFVELPLAPPEEPEQG